MANVIDGIFLAHQPAIARVDSRPNKMLQSWLSTGTFAPRSDPALKMLYLERSDWIGLSEAMASDIDRLARAGRETLQVTTCTVGMPNASAWILIQAYYASFYFAQAIMRVCGISPSYYTPGELNNLNRILQAYRVTPPFKLEKQLLIKLDGAAKVVEISKGDGGASHEAAWFEFKRLLEYSASLVKSSTMDSASRIQVNDDIARLQSAISGAPNVSSKLSSIRNSVQYRQEMGAWHPYTNATKSEDLKRRINSSLGSRDELVNYEINHHISAVRFLESCLCVCNVGRLFLKHIENRYGSGFLKNGFCKLDNQYTNTDKV